MLIDKKAILEAQDFDFKDVEVPEWGGSIRLRSLSSHDRDAFEADVGQTQDFTNLRARLVARAIVDEDGARLFSDREALALGNKSANVLNRLFDEVREMNGMGDEALESAEGN